MHARGNYRDDVLTVVKYLKSKTPMPNESTSHNPFQGVAGVDMALGDYRVRKPWAFIKAVSEGRSAPRGYNNPLSWQQHMQHYLDDRMFKK